MGLASAAREKLVRATARSPSRVSSGSLVVSSVAHRLQWPRHRALDSGHLPHSSAPYIPMRAAALAAVLLAWGCAAVCFNDCSGHGECRGYECWCEPGWDGEDCRHRSWPPPAPQAAPLRRPTSLPRQFCAAVAAVNGTARRPLSVGHANVTSMHSITKLARRYPLLMVGLSSRSCMACLAVEPEYAALAPFLRGSGGKLVRVDGDRHYEVARALRAPSLPFTVFFVDGKRFPFHGPHRSRELRAFAEKLRGPPVHMLSSATAVDAALSPGQPSWAGYSMSSHYVTVGGGARRVAVGVRNGR